MTFNAFDLKFKGALGEYFEIQEIDDKNCTHLQEQQTDTLRLLWFTSDQNEIVIDGIDYKFDTDEIICLTQFHTLEYKQINSVNLLRFNKPFYCIVNHDSEVGCKGLLYYGAAAPPIIRPDQMEKEVLKTAWKMASLEFEMKDNLQLEMLQMMLKRLLILCTRIFKRQKQMLDTASKKSDLFREFNYLVESHFRTKHTVVDYADLLFKSPKTLSNSFKKMGVAPPLQIIQERIGLEAKRLLTHTQKDVSEIAYSLGFKDLQTFSRFFKKNVGVAPSEYRA